MVTSADQSHFLLIFELRNVTVSNRINSVPWMNGVTPAPYHEWPQLVQKILWLNWMKATQLNHGTQLMWPHSFVVSSWCDLPSWYRQGLCDHVHSWYGVDAIWFAAGVIPYSVHYTVVFIWRILCLFLCIVSQQSHYSMNSPCGVKKISRKWLWPVKVTLKVIKRHLRVFLILW